MYLQNKPLFLINIFVLYLHGNNLFKIYYSFSSVKFYTIENKKYGLEIRSQLHI
jgi:hypothetical protein